MLIVLESICRAVIGLIVLDDFGAALPLAADKEMLALSDTPILHASIPNSTLNS